MGGKRSNREIEDLHLHFIVLLTVIIEKIEDLQEEGQIFGRVKIFLKNSLKYFTKFIDIIYDMPDDQTVKESTEGVFILQERVENALDNKYVLSISERENRLKNILSNTALTSKEIDLILEETNQENILKH